jgi:hypothetical protein
LVSHEILINPQTKIFKLLNIVLVQFLVNDSLNVSSVDFFSPPKNPDMLLFGSGGSSSEDELIARSASSSKLLTHRSVSLILESPIKADETENRENSNKLSARRSLMSHYPKNSPRLKGLKTTEDLVSHPLTAKDSNTLADLGDVFNDSFEALEKSTILTPKLERVSLISK